MGNGKVLVVGGAGYIGSQTCKELEKAGYDPVTLDNLSTGHRPSVKWGQFIEGDMADAELLDKLFRGSIFKGVMHFAAHSQVGESVEDPAKYYRNNVASTLTLLEAMVRHKVPNIIFSSTAAVYGIPESTPITEDHPTDPINPYGRSKLMVENIIKDFEKAYGLKFSILRYFNAAGADPDGELWERHDPETHLIPLILQAAHGKRDSIKIYGTDYPTPDGTCIRDYIHVTDLAQAHLKALARLMGGSDSLTCNLGTGMGHSVREVIEIVRKVTGKEFKIEETPRRPGDPPNLIAYSERASDELDWKPNLSAIDEIARTAASDFSVSS